MKVTRAMSYVRDVAREIERTEHFSSHDSNFGAVPLHGSSRLSAIDLTANHNSGPYFRLCDQADAHMPRRTRTKRRFDRLSRAYGLTRPPDRLNR